MDQPALLRADDVVAGAIEGLGQLRWAGITEEEKP